MRAKNVPQNAPGATTVQPDNTQHLPIRDATEPGSLESAVPRRESVYESRKTRHDAPMFSGKRLMSAGELALYIGTTRGQVYQMVSRRQVPFVKIGRSTRFDLNAIDRWIAQQSISAALNNT